MTEVSFENHPSDMSIPEEFFCPITKEVMTDPVIDLVDGTSYERSAIFQWLRNNNTSPASRHHMLEEHLQSNDELLRAIKDKCPHLFHKRAATTGGNNPKAKKARKPNIPKAKKPEKGKKEKEKKEKGISKSITAKLLEKSRQAKERVVMKEKEKTKTKTKKLKKKKRLIIIPKKSLLSKSIKAKLLEKAKQAKARVLTKKLDLIRKKQAEKTIKKFMLNPKVREKSTAHFLNSIG